MTCTNCGATLVGSARFLRQLRHAQQRPRQERREEQRPEGHARAIERSDQADRAGRSARCDGARCLRGDRKRRGPRAAPTRARGVRREAKGRLRGRDAKERRPRSFPTFSPIPDVPTVTSPLARPLRHPRQSRCTAFRHPLRTRRCHRKPEVTSLRFKTVESPALRERRRCLSRLRRCPRLTRRRIRRCPQTRDTRRFRT